MTRDRDFLKQTLDEQQKQANIIHQQHETDMLQISSLQQTIQQQQNQITELQTQLEEKGKTKSKKVDKDAPPTLEEDDVIVTLNSRVADLEAQLAEEKKARMEGAEVIRLMKLNEASQSDGVSQVLLDDFKKEVDDKVKGLESRLKVLQAENERLKKSSGNAILQQTKKEINDKMAKYKDEIAIMKRRVDLLLQQK